MSNRISVLALARGVAAGAMALFGSTALVHASPITYTLTTTASGTLGTSTFTNATVILTVSGDTSGVISAASAFGPGFVGNPGTASISITGLPTATFTDPIYVISSGTGTFQGANIVLILDETNTTGILLQEGSGFSGYQLVPWRR